MTAITTNTSLPGAPLSSQTRANAGTAAKNTANATVTSGTSLDDRSHGPSSTVELSDRAKDLLARTKIEQAIADQLAEVMLAASDDKSRQKPQSRLSSDELSQLFQSTLNKTAQAAGKAAPRADPMAHPQSTTQWQNHAPYGDPTMSDEQFLSQMKDTLLWFADIYDQNGSPPEVGQALRDAVKNGTVKVQRASDVPDLNFKSTQTFTPSALGGGYDSIGGITQNPTGATKEAIDQGRAIALWNMDRGDIYISW
jgi:hypothetical protein